MKAVILAAGRGKRMMPLTEERPKPLLQVLGKPLLDHMIENLPPEVDELVVVVGYLGNMIREHLGDSFKKKPIVYVEQKEQRGPAHALQLVRDVIAPGERFFFLFADDIYDAKSFASLLKHPQAVLVAVSKTPERFGVVLADAEGKIVDIEEKPAQPKSDLVLTGAYLFDSHIFDYEMEAHSNGEYFLPPIMMKMNKEHPLFVERATLWIPIGYPEDLKKAEAILGEK